MFLEFLDLKDEYSERDLEEALIRRLETFLLELGGDFCFGRQTATAPNGTELDLFFFHDAVARYANHAREHWVHEGENPPSTGCPTK